MKLTIKILKILLLFAIPILISIFIWDPLVTAYPNYSIFIYITNFVISFIIGWLVCRILFK